MQLITKTIAPNIIAKFEQPDFLVWVSLSFLSWSLWKQIPQNNEQQNNFFYQNPIHKLNLNI